LKRTPGGGASAGASSAAGSGARQAYKGPYLNKPLVYMTKSDLTLVRDAASINATRLQPLRKGVQGYVIAESNGYYLMDSGNWTYKPNVEILKSAALPESRVGEALLATGQREVEISFSVPYFTSYYVDVADDVVLLTLHQTKGVAMRSQADNPLFGDISFAQEGGHAVYTLPLSKPGRLYGYFIEYDGAKKRLTFRFRNPVAAADGERPLAGAVILVDAGHGGGDTGAQGPAGNRGKTEKDVNLDLALALESVLLKAGAEVIMVRREDIAVDLDERAEIIRETRPDLAVSLHRNSVGAHRDINQYQGILALYSHQQSVSFARYLCDALVSGTSHHYDGVRWQSLAVTRIEECPAVLLELGYISNPADYERMNRTSMIYKEAQAILGGIVAYLADS